MYMYIYMCVCIYQIEFKNIYQDICHSGDHTK